MTTITPEYAAEMQAKAREAAAHLLGSCEPLYHHYEASQDDTTFCAMLDSLVLECTRCGWWVEASDTQDDDSGQVICNECGAEGAEEGEED